MEVTTGFTSILDQISSEEMAYHQQMDNQISPVLRSVQEQISPTKSTLYKVQSKNARRLMFQYDHLALKQNVLHWLYIHQDLEYHQLVLPQRYQARVLKALHDDMGHQGLERTLALLCERVYWPSMAKDAAMWIDRCHCCQVSKGTYNEPQPKLGDLIANNPLDLLCIDFTKVNPSRNGKENVLVMTDAFTKLSQTVVTPNQKALTVVYPDLYFL